MRAGAGIFGGGVGGSLGQLNEFDDVTLSQAATSAARQGIAGFGGGLLEAGIARILGGDATKGAGRALNELRDSTVEGRTINLSEAFEKAGGFSARTGRFQGMRDFFSKVVGGESPAVAEDQRLTSALFENLKKLNLPAGRKVLSTGTKDSLEELQTRLASKVNRTRPSLREIIPQPSVKDPLTGKFMAQPPRVIERAIQPGDFIAMDSTGKLLAFPPGKAATIPKSFTPITGSKGLGVDEFEAIQRLAKGEPGKILALASPTNDNNLVAFRIFNQLLPEADRGFLRRQFVNKWLVGPSVEFVKEAQGVQDPRKAGRYIAFNSEKFIKQINSFGPEKFDMALGAGVGDALLKIANFMREAEVGKAARIAGTASSTQANYAFNKWSFSLQSSIGVAAGAGATGALAAGAGGAATGIIGGFAAIVPFARMMSTILNSPAAADLFIDAAKGNSSAASKFLAYAIAADPEQPPQVSQEGGKTTLVFPAPGQTETRVPAQPLDLQQMFQRPF